MSPFKSYKQIKLAVDKLLNLEVSVKLSDILILLLYLIFQIVVLVALTITLIKSGAL
ncbi:hypothetical protein [Pseudoalteromonas tetraodonis]|uniref:hypothetical protein n=1 Tax=Pseudoalteromonas tetraodonis TaxID=43659 RepID=UPI0015869485|nr:hypothetical protein [Pseudoalteromonas tetraodonis]